MKPKNPKLKRNKKYVEWLRLKGKNGINFSTYLLLLDRRNKLKRIKERLKTPPIKSVSKK